MKTLNHYAESSKDFFAAACEAKTDDVLRGRLTLVEAEVGRCYDAYDGHFATDSLTSIVASATLNPSRTDLHSLYNYKSKTFRAFRGQIAALQPQAIRYTCQYCTLTPSQSLDHYVPKEAFPEFSVHTLNLIPCCSTCNGHKSYVWKDGDQRLFINYYLDVLPDEQYLFVEISEDANGELDFRFFLENVSDILDVEFDRIVSHFTRLKLFKRMKRSAVGMISELKNSVLSGVEKASLADVIDTVRSTAQRNMVSYGNNHWKAILEIALIESDVFLAHVFA
jgi:hypothetical protein